MKIQIVGVGVVGEAQAYLASQLGHQVFGFDPRKQTCSHATMVSRLQTDVDITFICVPELEAERVVQQLVDENVGGLYVMKSSVPPGTTRSLMDKHRIHMCHNPEFLREISSFEDVMRPNFVLIGQCCSEHAGTVRDFYFPLGCPPLFTDPTTSETVKITLNSYLATLISFWNAVDGLTGLIGVDTKEVARILRCDHRVSRYGTDFFGAPFGGKCLPKDLSQLIQCCHRAGTDADMLEAVRDSNRKLGTVPV